MQRNTEQALLNAVLIVIINFSFRFCGKFYRGCIIFKMWDISIHIVRQNSSNLSLVQIWLQFQIRVNISKRVPKCRRSNLDLGIFLSPVNRQKSVKNGYFLNNKWFDSPMMYHCLRSDVLVYPFGILFHRNTNTGTSTNNNTYIALNISTDTNTNTDTRVNPKMCRDEGEVIRSGGSDDTEEQYQLGTGWEHLEKRDANINSTVLKKFQINHSCRL